ncbi:DUF7848 domain-containing protein [Streptomyces nigrescens]
MVTRTLAFAEWELKGNDGEGVPIAIFEMACMSCDATSDATDNDGRPQQNWALEHTGLNPSHRSFKLITETYWRVEPTPGNPYAELPAPQHP